MNFKITAYIMRANYGNLGKEVKNIQKGGIDSFHIYIMDRQCVPNFRQSSQGGHDLY